MSATSRKTSSSRPPSTGTCRSRPNSSSRKRWRARAPRPGFTQGALVAHGCRWHRARRRRRRRLHPEPVQPRRHLAPPAGLDLQALRLPGRHGKGLHARHRRRRTRPFNINGWSPENSDGKYMGEITLRQALAYSRNTVAAQLAVDVGPEAVVEVAQRMGISSPLHGRALDRARHPGSLAARTDRRLCALRQWRQSASSPTSSPASRPTRARCSTTPSRPAPARSSRPKSSAR